VENQARTGRGRGRGKERAGNRARRYRFLWGVNLADGRKKRFGNRERSDQFF